MLNDFKFNKLLKAIFKCIININNDPKFLFIKEKLEQLLPPPKPRDITLLSQLQEHVLALILKYGMKILYLGKVYHCIVFYG